MKVGVRLTKDIHGSIIVIIVAKHGANEMPTELIEETECPKNANGWHEPNWQSIHIEHDGDGIYVDVTCKHCGQSGCVGTEHSLADAISWE